MKKKELVARKEEIDLRKTYMATSCFSKAFTFVPSRGKMNQSKKQEKVTTISIPGSNIFLKKYPGITHKHRIRLSRRECPSKGQRTTHTTHVIGEASWRQYKTFVCLFNAHYILDNGQLLHIICQLRFLYWPLELQYCSVDLMAKLLDIQISSIGKG